VRVVIILLLIAIVVAIIWMRARRKRWWAGRPNAAGAGMRRNRGNIGRYSAVTSQL